MTTRALHPYHHHLLLHHLLHLLACRILSHPHPLLTIILSLLSPPQAMQLFRHLRHLSLSPFLLLLLLLTQLSPLLLLLLLLPCPLLSFLPLPTMLLRLSKHSTSPGNIAQQVCLQTQRSRDTYHTSRTLPSDCLCMHSCGVSRHPSVTLCAFAAVTFVCALCGLYAISLCILCRSLATS